MASKTFGFKITGAFLTAIVFLAVGIVAASRIYDPFAGDQALFLVGAEKLHGGAAMYRDFWDLKQPGIYDFFLVAGSIFGFTQTGEHIADMVWQLAFCVVLAIALATAMRNRLAALFAPIAVVGAYYAGSSSWHLMQVEGLVGFPIFCSTWAAIAATRSAKTCKWLMIASGFAAGIVILFKAFLGVVPLAIAIAICLTANQRRDAKQAVYWCVGASIPLLIAAIGMIANGTLIAALTTTFVLPYQIVTTVAHAPYPRLFDSFMRLLLYYRGIILLGIIGLVAEHDVKSRPWRIACVTWLIVGTIVILVQIESWWQYHVLLLVPPIGILSTFGFDYLVDRVTKGRWTTLLALAGCGIVAYVAVPLPQGAIGTILLVAKDRPFESAASLERYRIATSSEYEISFADARKLNVSEISHEPIYVFGEPLIYVIIGREQAIAMNGWAPQVNTDMLWRRTYAELADERPKEIFVNENFHRYLASSLGGSIESFLNRNYYARTRTGDGIWYALRKVAFLGRPLSVIGTSRPNNASNHGRRSTKNSLILAVE